MKSLEIGSVTPENNDAKVISQFFDFGIKDQKIINKLLGYGKIVSIRVFRDALRIFYKTGKHKEVIVKKGEIKKIDPKSNEVMETQTHFAIDLKPESYYSDPYITLKEHKKYPDYERQSRRDLVDTVKRVNKGEIVED